MHLRILLLTCALASFSFAQSTQPALDSSTPRGALKLFFTAEVGEDGDALKHLLAAENPAQEHLIAAVAAQKNADRALTDALYAKFPDQWKADPRKAALAVLPAIYQNIDKADQQINGDTATVHAAGSDQPPVTLKRVKGQWRIPLAVISTNVDPADVDKRAHQVEIQAGVMRQAASDVSAGKYATKDEAIQDVKQRMYTAALADHVASTQATTRP